MKKQFFQSAILLLFGVFCPALFSVAGNPGVNVKERALATPPCAAPAPAFFIVTNLAPTSISLTWGPGGTGTYYKLEGFDNTNFTPLPTVYTTLLAHTYSGLTPGHNYTFSISASFCPGGPWGPVVSLNRTTPRIIIIDIVMGLQSPCTPNQTEPTGNNVSFDICVLKSDNASQPFNNAFIGELQYDANHTLDFAIAFNGTNAYVGIIDQNDIGDFDFEWAKDPNGNPLTYREVDCFYLDTLLFTIHNMNIPGTSPNPPFTNLTITFHREFPQFSYCGSCTGERSDSEAWSNPAETEQSPLKVLVTPNPFDGFATLSYELAEESLVEITLFDATGRQVRLIETSALRPAGSHRAVMDGTNLPDGVYFLHLQTDRAREVLTLVKRE